MLKSKKIKEVKREGQPNDKIPKGLFRRDRKRVRRKE